MHLSTCKPFCQIKLLFKRFVSAPYPPYTGTVFDKYVLGAFPKRKKMDIHLKPASRNIKEKMILSQAARNSILSKCTFTKVWCPSHHLPVPIRLGWQQDRSMTTDLKERDGVKHRFKCSENFFEHILPLLDCIS